MRISSLTPANHTVLLQKAKTDMETLVQNGATRGELLAARDVIADLHRRHAHFHNQAVVSGRAPYLIFPMESGFIGEQFLGCPIVTGGLTLMNSVRYFSAKGRSDKEVIVEQGRLLINGGVLDTSLPINTVVIRGGRAVDKDPQGDEKNQIDVVMDGFGGFFAGRGRQGILHHSSFFAGGPVAFSGMLKVIDGRLERVTGQTKHYPDPVGIFAEQFFRRLEDELGITVPEDSYKTLTLGSLTDEEKEFLESIGVSESWVRENFPSIRRPKFFGDPDLPQE